MPSKDTTPLSLYGNDREYLREQEKTNELLADIAGETYESPGNIPNGKYIIQKRMLDAAQKKNELLESIAGGGGTGGGGAAKGISIDYATDVISLKNKDGVTIEGSGATLPAYGVSFDPTTGGLTLTKNGTAMQGQTVTIPNYGSPVGVTSASDMTDHNTIYLYEGTTGGGYTQGHFYYWDGTAWADGGEYAAATVQTDKTLLVENRAADAKAVGDAVSGLKESIGNYELNSGYSLGFIPSSGNEFPTTNPTYPNATYKLIPLKAGMSLHFVSNADFSSGRARCIYEGTIYEHGITTDENEYFISTANYGGSWQPGIIIAKKDITIGLCLLRGTAPEDTGFSITFVGANDLTDYVNKLYDKSISDYITPEMFGAVGDGVTDDTTAFLSAVGTEKLVYCFNKYKITSKIQLKNGVTGGGEIIFSGNGCFTFSVGTVISNIIVKTANKFIDFYDSDITHGTIPNVHARVLVKDVTIICEENTQTLISMIANRRGVFNFKFENINVTGKCQRFSYVYVNKYASEQAWMNNILFENCMCGSPQNIITCYDTQSVTFNNCTSQKDEYNANSIMYDVSKSDFFYMINCFDYDWGADSKIYKFVDCKDCVIMGNYRNIGNFDMTFKDFYDTFTTVLMAYGENPPIYNTSRMVVNNLMQLVSSYTVDKNVAYMLSPVHGLLDNNYLTGIRVTNANNSAGYHAQNSFDLMATPDGKLKLRIRVDDVDVDENNHALSKWSDWYTFTPDS